MASAFHHKWFLAHCWLTEPEICGTIEYRAMSGLQIIFIITITLGDGPSNPPICKN
jgi:hypothetical protein